MGWQLMYVLFRQMQYASVVYRAYWIWVMIQCFTCTRVGSTEVTKGLNLDSETLASYMDVGPLTLNHWVNSWQACMSTNKCNFAVASLTHRVNVGSQCTRGFLILELLLVCNFDLFCMLSCVWKMKYIHLLLTGTYPSPKACASLVVYKESLILFGGWSHPTPYTFHQVRLLLMTGRLKRW